MGFFLTQNPLDLTLIFSNIIKVVIFNLKFDFGRLLILFEILFEAAAKKYYEDLVSPSSSIFTIM